MNEPQKIILLGGVEVWHKGGKSTVCKKCGAWINWAITSKAKSIPICKNENDQWIAHFANCKYADVFRMKPGDGDRLDDELEQQRRERRKI